MGLSPLKRFMLGALLWLPLAFFLWFWFAAAFSWPVIQMAKLVLLKAWPSLFSAVSQGADLLDAHGRILGHPGYLMQLTSGVLVNAAAPGTPARFGFLEPVVNPMIYGYALPLFAGLVLATPLTRRQRFAQISGGAVIIWLAQAFGVVAESLKSVCLDAGTAGAEAAQRVGVSLDLIALAYQFGYLILPALVPAVLWIVCNRPFIETLIGRDRAEPTASDAVEVAHSGGD
ncbi:MAG: exosortase H-associated membrane protein [Rudaea sp.]